MRSSIKPEVRQADRLARLAVFARDHYRCLCCGKQDVPLEWAHVITKGMGGGNRFIRWDPDNAVTLCHGDHDYFTRYPARFKTFIADLYGPDRWDDLKRRQAAAERRGDSVDVQAVIRGFKLALTPAESARYAGGDW